MVANVDGRMYEQMENPIPISCSQKLAQQKSSALKDFKKQLDLDEEKNKQLLSSSPPPVNYFIIKLSKNLKYNATGSFQFSVSLPFVLLCYCFMVQ